MAFVAKRLHGASRLGPDVAELRERAGLSIEEVARQTKLAPSFIRALEGERWQEIPDPVYSERLLRLYVSHLGGNESFYVHKYRECLALRNLARKPDERLPRPIKLTLSDRLVAPRLIAAAGFFVFTLFLGGYVYWQATAISEPPPLELESPSDGLRIEGPAVQVIGKTLPEASVTVNGRNAIVGSDGRFESTLYVPRGTTMIIVAARRRYSREVTLVRRIQYDREVPMILPASATNTNPSP